MQTLGIGRTMPRGGNAPEQKPISCQRGCLILLLLILIPLMIIVVAVRIIDEDCRANNPGARCGDAPSDSDIMERERQDMERRGHLPPSR
jgi:hypothetical protein